ncbi:MAG: hypothetical protein IT223_06320 [Crocinitomicaceae bacterium]|nr:hypothetical protein [Crocinitomicaceae bacterium]
MINIVVNIITTIIARPTSIFFKIRNSLFSTAVKVKLPLPSKITVSR